VHGHGQWHAPIHPDVKPVRNTGFLFEHRVFHPGDAYTDPHTPVRSAFRGPIRAVHPLRVGHRLHPPGPAQAGLPDARHRPRRDGLAGADGFLVKDKTPPFAPGTGSPYVRLDKATVYDV